MNHLTFTHKCTNNSNQFVLVGNAKEFISKHDTLEKASKALKEINVGRSKWAKVDILAPGESTELKYLTKEIKKTVEHDPSDLDLTKAVKELQMESIMTSSEAERRWGLKEGTIRSACTRGKLKKYVGNGVKQTDRTWLVMEWVMIKEYGEEKSMKAIYEKAVKLVGYDGTTDEDVRYYDSMQDYRNDTQYDTDEDFNNAVSSVFNVDPNEVEGPIIVLDSIGSVDGEIFTSEDDEEYILDTIKEYFK